MAKKEPLYGQISVSKRAELTDFKLDSALNLGRGAGVHPQSWDQIGPWGLGWGGWVGETCWASFFLKSRHRQRAIRYLMSREPLTRSTFSLWGRKVEKSHFRFESVPCTLFLSCTSPFTSVFLSVPSGIHWGQFLTSWSCDGQPLTSSLQEGRWFEPAHGLHVKQLSVLLSLSLLAFFSFPDRKRCANVSNNWLPRSNSSVKGLLD